VRDDAAAGACPSANYGLCGQIVRVDDMEAAEGLTGEALGAALTKSLAGQVMEDDFRASV
jgi:hypothetical protein